MVVLIVGGGGRLWVWGIVHRCWVVGGLVHVGGLFVGAGLSFMAMVVMCCLLCGHH